MSNVFTPLNLEQSIARYLADKLLLEGYNVKWLDTGQTESAGGAETASILREFPPDPRSFAKQNGPTGKGIINTPAFSIYAANPSTRPAQRTGIGEGVFEWTMSLRVDGFADSELQWYSFVRLFKAWFGHPDVRVTLRDYETDLSSTDPTECGEFVQFDGTDIIRQELQEQPAVRYYLNVTTTALFIE